MFSPSRNTLADREGTILCVGLVVGFLFCMFLAWLPLRITIFRFVFEDSFYYLRVARSIVDGSGSSFDGIHPTNGYHPLWMLISVLLVFPFKLGSVMPFHLLLSVCCVFHVLTAVLIYKTVLLGGHRGVAVFAALVWLLNYNVAGIALCGLETAMFAFFAIATVHYYLLRRNDLTARQSVGVGVMLGVTALARLDGALLGIALAIDQLLLGVSRKERLTGLLKRIAPMSLAGSAMMTPWLVLSYSISGTIFPNSHRAVRLWYGPDELLRNGMVKGLVGILMNHAPVMARIYGFVPLSLLSLVLFAVFCGLLLKGRERRKVGLPIVVFVMYPIAHTLYYTRYFEPYNRYLYPAHMLVFAGAMTAIGCWMLGNKNGRFVRWCGMAAGVVIIVNLILSGIDTWKQGTASVRTHSAHWTMFNKALPWIKENVKPHERVGAFNSGIYGYLSGRTIVNLDGVMNDSVIPVLEEGRLIPYLYQERITYVVDWEITIEETFEALGGVPDYRSKFAVVATFEQPWGLYTGARLIVLRLIY